MIDVPVQTSGAAPAQIEDPNLTAEEILADPSREGTPEWLAAKQILTEQHAAKTDGVTELEKEMQGVRGMSEI